jgi:hypothetical protein
MKNENTKPQNFCSETESLIDEHLEGMISLNDKVIMDEHIAGCDSCKNYLQETQKLIKDLSALNTGDVTISAQKKDELWASISSQIDTSKYVNENTEREKQAADKGKVRSGFLHKYRYFFTGAAAVLILGFIIYGIKDMEINNDRLMQQSSFGLASYWKVSNLQGNSRIGDIAMSNNDSVKEGQWIQTNFDSRAELIVADMGRVIIEPNSKVLFVKGTEGNNRILVEYGTINTDMNPNSKSFFVEMPSAVATDNGSSYTMTVDKTGDGLVFVKSGKVDIESQNRDAVIPAGSLVLTKKDIGVGTPFNENSSEKFKNALLNFDFGNCSGTCVSTLLNAAKVTDAVTLVNLIPKIEQEYKNEVYVKLANFVSPPAGVRVDSLKFMDEKEMNEWIDKIQTQVQEKVEKSMKDVEKSLEELKKLEYFNPEKFTKGFKDFEKNFEFKVETNPEGAYFLEIDSAAFDKEQFKKDMEEMKRNIEENSRLDKEQLKKEMNELKENLKVLKEDMKLNLNNEELKKEMEKASEEMRKALEELNKLNIRDSINSKVRGRVKINGNDEEIETPESLETPESPEEPEGMPK